MAAKETIHSQQSGVESIVNRWVVDYYLFLALESYKNGEPADFYAIRLLLKRVLGRPYESPDALPTKIGILQFLSRIYDGERLDLSFESDHSRTPLESALMLLDDLTKKCSISQEDLNEARSSIKDMMVRVFIKNSEFDKAKGLLIKHFPKPMVGKKAIYMGLISRKSKQHELIERMDFQQFKEEMLTFCKKFCNFRVPFLQKAATELIDKRLIELSDIATGSDNQGQSGATNPQMINTAFVPWNHTVIPRSRLEEVFTTMAAGSKGRTFSQLEEEVEREGQARNLSLHLSPTPEKSPELNGLFQRESGSPMEASPAEQTPQTDTAPETQAGSLSRTHSVPKKRRLYTVAQLVVEPDSQSSSTLSQEQETELGAEELQQPPAVSDGSSQSLYLTDTEIAPPSRRQTRKRSCRASPSLSSDSEGEAPGPVDTRKTNVGERQNQLNTSLSSRKSRQLSSDSDEDLENCPGPVDTRKTKTRERQNQLNTSLSSRKSRQLSSDSDKDSGNSPATSRTPAVKTRKQMASNRLSNKSGSEDGIQILDASLDTSPKPSSSHQVPQTSSTPHKDSPHDKDPSRSKWSKMMKNAQESKERWSDEESYFSARKSSGSHETSTSSLGQKRRKWTETETQKLIEGVKKFGEGNWGKIKAYYDLKDRTNVNLKDRWRTLKKLNIV